MNKIKLTIAHGNEIAFFQQTNSMNQFLSLKTNEKVGKTTWSKSQFTINH